PDPIDRFQEMRRGPGVHRRQLRMPLERQLTLTEAQRDQLRAIRQKQFESTRSFREELFQLREKRRGGTFTDEDAARAQSLRQQMQEARKGIRGEFQNVLTPEQRDQVEQLRKERKQQREEIRQRLQLRNQNPL